jgi:gag-polypeptide of LTR copia-type/Zinc knuckle
MSFPTDNLKLESKHLIPKFNNGPKDRYHVWCRRVEFALRDKDLCGLVTGETNEPVYQEWVPNPAPNAGTANIPENIPNPQSREDFAISESVQKWKRSKETASSLLMRALGDDIVNDLMNELGDPAAMWKTLEDTSSSKTGTNILTIMNGVVTKKLGRNERMSTHIGHLDSLLHQLTNIQGSDEANENGQKKDLTITGDIFKICMPQASIAKVGEYDAVFKAIRGVSDGAASYRAVKSRLLESYNEKHPGSGSIFDHTRNRLHGGNHRHGQSVRVALEKDDKSNITCYNCNKVGHHANECRSKKQGKGKAVTRKEKAKRKKQLMEAPTRMLHGIGFC